MIPASVAQMVEQVGLWTCLGALMGGLSFAALRGNVGLYLAGGPVWKPIGLHLLRLTIALGGFVMIAPAGALALLSALAGFLIARTIAVRIGGREP
jgi:F1F0 ATPase subunit 2